MKNGTTAETFCSDCPLRQLSKEDARLFGRNILSAPYNEDVEERRYHEARDEIAAAADECAARRIGEEALISF
jgi:hypothetical protein